MQYQADISYEEDKAAFYENNQNMTVPGFHTREISSTTYVKNLFKNPTSRSLSYLKNIFPVIDWFPHYPTNLNWMLSDFITGVTVAIVLVPQSMSYAKLATLSPEFGLYSAFIGAMFYFLFATSREICIGPVAVLSQEVGKIVTRVQGKYPGLYSNEEIATTLALISGGIVLGIGLLKLGFIVELLSLPAILAFTTGSAFNIVAGQLAGLFGFSKKAGKHKSTCETIIAFLKHLPDTEVDVAFGLTGLVILYIWQFTCEYYLKKYKSDAKKRIAITYILNLRTAFVIIISTCISFGVLRYRPHSKKAPYSIIGDIPSGLKHVGRFVPPPGLAKHIASELPISTIVLVLEHISISKSFARINGYRVNPNQEFIAIGVTNMVGTFFGAYPVTGSFSRTALSAKCGVKTPLKALITGCSVLLSIYCFTNGFYYIPNATLCAIIIHCVAGLLASYKLTTKLYMFSPVDFIIFITGVFITVFATIEDGIYFALCASAAQLLWRLCLPNGAFLGRVKVATLENPILLPAGLKTSSENSTSENGSVTSINKTPFNESTKQALNPPTSYVYKWVPLPKEPNNPSKVHTRFINGNINVEKPPSGVLVYRMSESFVYSNCSLQIDQIIAKVRADYKPHNDNRERLWCEYTYAESNWKENWKHLKMGNFRKFFNKEIKDLEDANAGDDVSYDGNESDEYIQNRKRIEDSRPVFRILHLDFSQVVAVDATSVQALLDLQMTIDHFVGPQWEMHFSGIINPWITRALINAGFGAKRVDVTKIENSYLKRNLQNGWFEKLPTPSFLNRYLKSSTGSIDLEDTEFTDKADVFPGDLDVGFAEDNSPLPLYSTDYPNIHFDIPSYSGYD